MARADFCAALQASALTTLTLRSRRSDASAPMLLALAAALAGHRTLRTLHLCLPLRHAHPSSEEQSPPTPGMDAALAALASAPALTALDVAGCNFCDAELSPLVAVLAAGALPRLRSLDLRGSELASPFARNTLAPAVAAAAALSLDDLRLCPDRPEHAPTFARDEMLRGLERAVAAAAAVRHGRFIFRVHHQLCVPAPGDEYGEAPIARALRAPGLKHVTLGGAYAAALAAGEHALSNLLSVLVGHPDLESLTLEGNFSGAAELVGDLLGELIAADAPLQALRIVGCELGDAGMAPLVAALPRNTRLRTLECRFNDMSPAFARDVLLPAVDANTGLRELTAEHILWKLDGVDAAMALVNSRGT